MPDLNYALNDLGAVFSANYVSPGYPASQAGDNNDLTMWAKFGGAAGYPCYLYVDLGAPQFITSSRCLAYNTGVRVFDIAYSSDAVNYNYVLQTSRGSGDYTDQTGGVLARYWRLTLDKAPSGSVGAYSWELWGPAEAPPNPTLPMCDQIEDWLDAVEANFKPCVDVWLGNNP